jgi:hypothetical protein
MSPLSSVNRQPVSVPPPQAAITRHGSRSLPRSFDFTAKPSILQAHTMVSITEGSRLQEWTYTLAAEVGQK